MRISTGSQEQTGRANLQKKDITIKNPLIKKCLLVRETLVQNAHGFSSSIRQEITRTIQYSVSC